MALVETLFKTNQYGKKVRALSSLQHYPRVLQRLLQETFSLPFDEQTSEIVNEIVQYESSTFAKLDSELVKCWVQHFAELIDEKLFNSHLKKWLSLAPGVPVEYMGELADMVDNETYAQQFLSRLRSGEAINDNRVIRVAFNKIADVHKNEIIRIVAARSKNRLQKLYLSHPWAMDKDVANILARYGSSHQRSLSMSYADTSVIYARVRSMEVNDKQLIVSCLQHDFTSKQIRKLRHQNKTTEYDALWDLVEQKVSIPDLLVHIHQTGPTMWRDGVRSRDNFLSAIGPEVLFRSVHNISLRDELHNKPLRLPVFAFLVSCNVLRLTHLTNTQKEEVAGWLRHYTLDELERFRTTVVSNGWGYSNKLSGLNTLRVEEICRRARHETQTPDLSKYLGRDEVNYLLQTDEDFVVSYLTINYLKSLNLKQPVYEALYVGELNKLCVLNVSDAQLAAWLELQPTWSGTWSQLRDCLHKTMH